MNPVIPTEYFFFIFGLALIVCCWLGWRSAEGASGKLRIVLILLRLAGFCCLGIIGLNPGHWLQESSLRETEWAVLIDKSKSMAVRDADGQSRWTRAVETASRIIKANPGKKIKLYTFADTLGNARQETDIDALLKLSPDGSTTDIYNSCNKALNRYLSGNVKLGGIIMLSDGRQVKKTSPADFILSSKAENLAVHAMGFGRKIPAKDLALNLPRRQFFSFAGQSLKIPFAISNQGMGNVETKVALRNEKGQITGNRKIRLKNNSREDSFFQVKIEKPGFYEYNAELINNLHEHISWNNSVRIGISVMKDKLKVLFLEGQPFWDSKFLSQLLRNDRFINLTNIYRIASGRYFAIRTGKDDGRIDKKQAFPDSAAALSKYNLIIFGKGAEYFLDPAKISNLRKYLADYGGAVMFARGKPYTGKFPALEPLEPVVWGGVVRGNFYWRPTAFGEKSGLFGDVLPAADSPVWRKLAPINVITACRRMKNFTEVLLNAVTVKHGKELKIPALMSRKFGKGIVITVNAEGIWQWGFFPESPDAEKFYRGFWLQLVQWIVRYSEFLPGSDVALRFDKTAVLPGRPIMAMINARENVSGVKDIHLLIRQNGKLCQNLTPVKNSTGYGWSCIVILNRPGTYNAVLQYRNKSGGTRQLHSIIHVKRPPDEEDNLSADFECLKKLCRDTGGNFCESAEAFSRMLAGDKSDEGTEIKQQKSWVSAWLHWWLLCLALLLFGAEYFFRRRNGLL